MHAFMPACMVPCTHIEDLDAVCLPPSVRLAGCTPLNWKPMDASAMLSVLVSSTVRVAASLHKMLAAKLLPAEHVRGH